MAGMTSTPTADELASFRNDLHRVAHLLATAGDAHRRGLATETLVAIERAGVLVDSLGEVVEWWEFGATARPAKPTPVAITVHRPDILDEDDRVVPAAFPCDWADCGEVKASVQALASHKRKHAREQLKAEAHDLRVEAEARAAAPKPSPAEPVAVEPPPLTVVADPPVHADQEMQGTTQTIGAYEVRTIGRRRFIRCPEIMCGRRVNLTDEQDQFEIADVLHSHAVSGECLARSKSAAKR